MAILQGYQGQVLFSSFCKSDTVINVVVDEAFHSRVKTAMNRSDTVIGLSFSKNLTWTVRYFFLIYHLQYHYFEQKYSLICIKIKISSYIQYLTFLLNYHLFHI